MDPLSKVAMEIAPFNCTKCPEKYTYATKSVHTKTKCTWLNLKCPLECQSVGSYMGVNALMFHLMDCKLVQEQAPIVKIFDKSLAMA
jgi:hypothetical protein